MTLKDITVCGLMGLGIAQWRSILFSPLTKQLRFSKMAEKLFKNPVTKEEKTAKEWTKIYKYTTAHAFRSVYRRWSKNGQPEVAFMIKSDRQKIVKSKNGVSGKKLSSPITGEKKTAKEWKDELEYSNVKQFIAYHYKWRERDPIRPFLSKKDRIERTHKKRPKVKSKIFTNHADNVGMTAAQWAIEIGISEPTFRCRVHKYGADDPRTYEKPRDHYANTATGPTTPYKNRRVKFKPFVPGILEQKYLGVDPYKHLDKEAEA
jgi:hypothetical protein